MYCNNFKCCKWEAEARPTTEPGQICVASIIRDGMNIEVVLTDLYGYYK